ncbi:tumor necrosis factor receptor superfamily member 26-like isoform X2 [Lethenteron reissneri]|uniref:tumor necrosis factor receptor superfamily member 26-like isoform X2 n=1 Tax=Lethenteron reissneri TaxID=7753 RepID=UPI002AB66632|nr:tumor necrosis factor receptor superfamily member 26-like isoform X2 [Lethenteron reissneri]
MSDAPNLLRVVCILIAVCVLTEAKCNDTTEYEDNGRCCEKCPPGFFMTEKCSEGSKASTCKSCTEESYSDTHSTDAQCKSCDVCNEEIRKTEVKPCTPTSNRECACEDGTHEFHDGGIEICCNNCPAGEALTSECKIDRPTTCTPCNDGTYSNGIGCNDGDKISAPRTTTSDTESGTYEGIFIIIVISMTIIVIFFVCICCLNTHHSSVDPLHNEVRKRI